MLRQFKGSKLSAGNYRPVSLTSQTGKIMESCLKDIITEHLNTCKYQLIKDMHYGFTSKRSCLTNLLVFLESVTDYILIMAIQWTSRRPSTKCLIAD